ncbi:MAG TPA: DUF1573 domain-containing protein, partial [Candidatus Limnocylindrales bacterium]|nr:DUF1573 domain-containing protein [Candidatus Limnocylindrales bacterium]
ASLVTGFAQNAPAPAQQTIPAATNSGARIAFAEPVFDFGRVESGKVVSHDFAFTNVGDQILIIQDVRPACGCTTLTNWANKPVPPGESGSIPILFNSGGMAGPIGKFLKVISNDPKQPEFVLRFNATIWKPLDAIPQIAVFNFGPDLQTNQTRVLRIVSNIQEPVTLSEPVCTNRLFRAELKTVHEGKEFELYVTVLTPLGPGSLTAPITLKTSSAKMPQLTVTAYATVAPALTVTPPRIFLPPTPLAKEEQFNVTIRNNSSNSVTLSEPAINAEGAVAQLRELQPGRLFSLDVTFPTGFSNRLGGTIEARLKSDHPQSPIVKVPVIGGTSIRDLDAGLPQVPLQPRASEAAASAATIAPGVSPK